LPTQQVTVTAPPEITLTAIGYKVRGLQKVDLAWSGAATEYVNIYPSSPRQSEFSGVLITTVPNGYDRDLMWQRGAGKP